MIRFLKWAAGVLAALVVLTLIGVVAAADAARHRHYDIPATSFSTAGRGAEEGARLARVYGCRDCHGTGGQGGVVIDNPALGRIVAPSLARSAAVYSDGELERVIRRGVKHDGTGVVVMPSGAFSAMADEDVRHIVAWVRTLKPASDEVKAKTRLGPVARIGLALGKFSPNVVATPPAARPDRPADIGRYYYESLCSDCHLIGAERRTPDGSLAPALAPMGAAYGDADFARLMRTGVGMGKRNLGLMSQISTRSLVGLRDGEIAAIQDYLKREASKL